MIPHMKLHERLLAWLLMRIEAKYGWGGGFSDLYMLDASYCPDCGAEVVG